MPVTTIAAGRAFTYVDNIGKIGGSATAFFYPSGLARDSKGHIYVANWGHEFQPNARISKIKLDSQDWVIDIGAPGDGDGQFLWPGHLASDSKENLWVTDQAHSRVVGFDTAGKFIGKWGAKGNGKGEFYMPAGIALTKNDDFLITDSRNSRVQRYDKNGRFLSQFGKQGSANGEFNLPWGVASDKAGNIYVADWGNSRVQKFNADGKYQMTYGTPGKGKGEIDHPSSVAIDKDGDVYVADWGNNRVVIFEADGTYLATIIGDAQNLSRWAQLAVAANPDLKKALERVNLEPMWKLWRPSSIHVGDDYTICIGEAQHQRVQIYKKDPKHQEAQFTL
ncbi:MAG: 6-bladed beta-propeller [SAR202 cluster bacterium]|nr:6-bladed beta-propeller [SAR202 cluster bacterium]